jgi:phosphopantetheine--protein transferase-like protein
MKDTDIAIVGMSCDFPDADNIEKFWKNLENGVDSIIDAPADRIDSDFFSKEGEDANFYKFYFKRGGFVNKKKIDPLRYGILPVALEGYDPEQLIALRLVDEALEDAGVYEKNIPLENCSFILGKGNFTGLINYKSASIFLFRSVIEKIFKYMIPDISESDLEKIKNDFGDHNVDIKADTAVGSMPSLIVSLVSNRFNLRGPTYTIDSACASALVAIDHSIRLLLNGQCDIALAGGMHYNQTVSFWSVFNLLGAASHRQQIAPFSTDADGLLIGEGAGIVVLKTLKKAIADNDRIYAVIKGSCNCSDGSGVSVMAPNAQGQYRTYELAWEKAGMDPKKIGYLEAHGTATQVGDRTEIAGLTRFFGDKSEKRVWLGSVKSNIGHIMPAAGIAGLIKTTLALYHKKIPPTLHCENPLKDVLASRFYPVQQLMDWDPDEYPLIAGVNAFGFGGTNAHVILEAFDDKKTYSTVPKQDRLIALSAPTKEKLLEKLSRGDYTQSEGDYRLIVFNPTQDRIEKAKNLVEKDKPWKGRLDIWFSNSPLLARGGKLVFMFTGFDFGTNAELQSISDYFAIPFKQVEAGEDPMVGLSINLYYKSMMINQALKKLGVNPDIYIGHSIGEWHALGASGTIDSESIEKCMRTYDPTFSYNIDIPYVAIGCDYERIKPWCENNPDLYLANDNCPNQILMAGTKQATGQLIEKLKEENIYFQVLPYQSASHTPFVPERIEIVNYMAKFMEPGEATGPVWSATSLEKYPTDTEEFRKLTIRHFTETVHFRGLIDKLYDQENAKVFIQIGAGNLLGFVDNTLSGKIFSTIGTLSSHNTGIEQLRRLLALLFVEGKAVNNDLLGIKEFVSKRPLRKGKEIELENAFHLSAEFPSMKEIMESKIEESIATSTPLPTFSTEVLSDPVLRIVNDNLRSIASVQEEMMKWYKVSHHSSPETGQSAATPETKNKVLKTGTSSQAELILSLDKYPFLMDHSIVKQKEGWPVVEDLNPVVPLAMAIELLSDYALSLEPDRKVLQINGAQIMKWLSVEKPLISTITGVWKSEDMVTISILSHATGDFILGDTFPPVPEKDAKEIDLGEDIVSEMPSKELVYRDYLFHGEKYQSLIKVLSLTNKGLRALIHKTEGKGSLLDNLGALLGLYLYFIRTEYTVTFPMNADEIHFYDDINDQSGIFEYTLCVKDINIDEIVSDVVIKRDGKVWCIANGFHNRRFEFRPAVRNAAMEPEKGVLSKELAPNVFYLDNIFKQAASWEFFVKRYLSLDEKKQYYGMYLNKARDFLISRIALKDAVRKYHFNKEHKTKYIFPLEVSISNDASGKPNAKVLDYSENIEVSLAHKGSEAAAIASDKPVGIDIEKIETRNKEFINLSFTEKELSLLESNDKDQAEWITRFWVAKEAYAKMIGTGLQGNPKQFEVTSIDGDKLQIRNTIIQTIVHKKNYIIGWTQI